MFTWSQQEITHKTKTSTLDHCSKLYKGIIALFLFLLSLKLKYLLNLPDRLIFYIIYMSDNSDSVPVIFWNAILQKQFVSFVRWHIKVRMPLCHGTERSRISYFIMSSDEGNSLWNVVVWKIQLGQQMLKISSKKTVIHNHQKPWNLAYAINLEYTCFTTLYHIVHHK